MRDVLARSIGALTAAGLALAGIGQAAARPESAAPEATAADGIGEAGEGSAIAVLARPDLSSVTFGKAIDAPGRAVDIVGPAVRPGGRGAGAARVPLRMLVAGGRVTGTVGLRSHPVLGGWRMHSGVDLAAAHGTPIVATSDGRVLVAERRGGYGLLVVVEHDNRLQTRYGHMARINVTPGQRVRAGEVIGYVGSTGMSTGPHLHYEVRVDGQPVDPLVRRKAK